MADIRTLEGPAEVAEVAANDAATTLSSAIQRHGTATWVLAGGSSPLLAYRMLAEHHAGALDWSKVTVLIGDERLVPHNDAASNWGQIVPLLTSKETMAAMSQLVPHTHLPADQAAADYERQIRALPSDTGARPRLDLVWLGVGEDGHTLSLFPGQEASWPDDGHLVVPVTNSPKPPSTRFTLTLTALEGAGRVVVFAVGAAKKDALSRALAQGDLPIALASSAAERAGAEVCWLFDRDARDSDSSPI